MTDEEAPECGETEDQQRQRLHDAARSELLDRQRSNSENYDKAILTFASGALGLSLSFIKDILPASQPVWVYLLYASWFLLVAAIVTTVASLLLSNEAINQALSQNTEYYLKKNEAAYARTTLSRTVDVSNYASGAFFVIGIALTVIFVSVNFSEVERMKTPKTELINLNGGQSIPQMHKVEMGDLRKGQTIPQMQPLTRPTEGPQAAAPQGTTRESAQQTTVNPVIPPHSEPKK